MKKSELVATFFQWAGEQTSPMAGDFVSGDGKSLKSTVNDYGNQKQDFSSTVSFYAQKIGIVLALAEFGNKQMGEWEVVINLLALLEGKGITLSLDALHSQKKR
ncbi:MAG: hypothetical protein H7Y04_06935 [Verrucomicrobia bacterium]|nr:hypothetical protein [Cytophagales bacterium]